jgi:L-amino acid N-acyltransferase YncA
MAATLTFAAMTGDDWPAVREIYEQGIETGQATFETSAPDWERFDRSHTQDCRLIAREDKVIVGWGALSPFSSRPVYRGVAEASVYIAQEVRGKGIGTALLSRLIEESERNGYWTLLGKIFPENAASLALVKRYGFREVGVLRRIGQQDGVWRDVVLLERRLAG